MGSEMCIRDSSWTTVAMCAPFRDQICPVLSARPPEADGESEVYRNHSSARKGRWNHMAWSRLAGMTSGSAKEIPARLAAASSNEMSLA